MMPGSKMLSLLSVWLFFAAYACARTFVLEMTWKTGAPDGFSRDMIFINGQFPGPTLNIQQGEWVEIIVKNKLPFNTTIHYHGIEQQNTPWSDGVPGLSQRPIQPGETYKYKWHADQYGSYFYHAHSRGQIDDGAYGAIIIKPARGVKNPFDKISRSDARQLEVVASQTSPLIISDWRHFTSDDALALEYASGFESMVCMDAILFNGKGSVDCWPQEDIDKYTPPQFAPALQAMNMTMTQKGCVPPILITSVAGGNASILPPEAFETCTPTKGSREVIKAPRHSKWLSLDIISSASIVGLAFSIDEHPLWIYAVDGHYIEPLKVDAVTVNNGDRYSVFVQLDKTPKNYGIRVASVSDAQMIDGVAVFSYESQSKPSYNTTVGAISSTPYINRVGKAAAGNITVFDQSRMVSFPRQFPQPPPEVEQTYILDLTTVGASYIWALNSTALNTSMIDNFDVPLLFQDPNKFTSQNVTIKTRNNTWIDLVFSAQTFPQPIHPIHKHSNKGFQIGSGTGQFKWKSVAEAAAAIPENFNLVNPAYRDGFTTAATVDTGAWTAVRYHVVNPGAFMIHCHIQSHFEGGMSMIILDGVDAWPHYEDYGGFQY